MEIPSRGVLGRGTLADGERGLDILSLSAKEAVETLPSSIKTKAIDGAGEAALDEISNGIVSADWLEMGRNPVLPGEGSRGC